MYHSPFRNLIVLIIAVAAVALAGIWFFSRPEPPPSPELGSPKLSLASVDEATRAKPLYFTRAAVPWLKKHWGRWQGGYGAMGPSIEELAAEFDRGLQSPRLWRVMDRKWRFGAVLLTGDPAAFRSLLESLRTAPDWVLTSVDPTSYLFERVEGTPGPRAWNSSADLPPLMAAFGQHPVKERLMARVQVAHRLMFLEDLTAARGLLEEAFKLNPKSKEAWTELALVEGQARRWPKALKAAQRALEEDGDYRPAKIARVEALYSMGRFNEALDGSRDLYGKGPVDGEMLLLHAKVTHAAHAYQEEAEVLERLITVVQGRGQPAGFWQIYLGQALSATGETLQAKEQFENALKDQTLDPVSRNFVLKALERLNTRQEAMPEEAVPTISPTP